MDEEENKDEVTDNPLFVEIENWDMNKEAVFRFLGYFYRCQNEFKDSKEEVKDQNLEDLKRAICDAFTLYYTSSLEFV